VNKIFKKTREKLIGLS